MHRSHNRLLSCFKEVGGDVWSLSTIAAEEVYTGYAFEILPVTNTAAVGLSSALYSDVTRQTLISVEDGAVRFRYDGGDPTSTTGHPISSGTLFNLQGLNTIKNFKVIAQSAAGATLSVTYER
ncbi:TPA: hypothetical protein DCX15_01225 [bacterium]|nr:hypothetical protein [bacterium]